MGILSRSPPRPGQTKTRKLGKFPYQKTIVVVDKRNSLPVPQVGKMGSRHFRLALEQWLPLSNKDSKESLVAELGLIPKALKRNVLVDLRATDIAKQR